MNCNKKINRKKLKKMTYAFIIVLLLSLTITKVGLKKLMGNVYNIDELDTNIDKIQIGDSINYTANGYSDWQVIYIDKENKTMDIIAAGIPENVTLSGRNAPNEALEILQNEANKYVTGPAVSARSAAQSDIDNITSTDIFWTSDVAKETVYFNAGVLEFVSSNNVFIVPVVTLNSSSDYENLSVGNDFNMDINGVSDWIIFSKNTSTSITIIPKNPKYYLDIYSERECKNYGTKVSEYINSFKVDEVESVRIINENDINTLNSLNSNNGFNISNGNIYAGDPYFFENRQDTIWEYSLERKMDNYKYKTLGFQTWGSRTYYSSDYTCSEYSYTLGFKPIVKIKFSDKKVEQKEVNTELNIGDNVNYEAKEYNNWKVLSIDESNGTVDVISGGVVKNLTLNGLDDWNNINSKLQNEVDEYKNGDKVISARALSYEDFNNLKDISDKTTAKYWVSNTYKYRSKDNGWYYYYYNTEKVPYSNIENYAVGYGFYNDALNDISREWAILYTDANSQETNGILSVSSSGPYSYMAGLRPIITLKLDQVQKVDESTVTKTNDESISLEQNNTNKTSNVVPYSSYNSGSTTSSSTQNEQIIESEANVTNVTKTKGVPRNRALNIINNAYKKYDGKMNYIILNLIIVNFIVLYALNKIFFDKKENE